MCGLVGFWGSGADREVLHGLADVMASCIAHRGPDDHGVWVDEEVGLAMGHRRLAVVDLSEAGHQPMVSQSGRFVIVYNGEVYNHLELRKELDSASGASRWIGHSDTETLLACIEYWGLEATLGRCVGMFGFAVWDRQLRALSLARDRVGEKPLYYGWQGGVFFFGSELKAFKPHPAFNPEVDRGSLTLLLRHNYIPAPNTIYPEIFKLMPGTWITISGEARDPQPLPYWSIRDVAERGRQNQFQGDEAEAVSELSRLLSSAVFGQSIADVPLGALLSGGIDSSLIAALMQAQSNKQIRTFTIGFEEKAYDEAVHARAVAAHLGTDHTELRLSASDALALIPRLPRMYDEPFADSSQLPTYLVMALAKQHVTVALSGDGGDEFFGGYNRYSLGPATWRRIGWLPMPLRRVLGSCLTAIPSGLQNTMLGPIAKRFGIAQPGDKAHRLGWRLRHVKGIDDLYSSLVSEWTDPAAMVIGGRIPWNLLDARDKWPELDDPADRMMAMDAMTYLTDDILVKVDRAAMASSLETRAPFLDRDVMEFAWRLPISMKIRGGKGKWILRQLLGRHLPSALFERPKMGFSIPLDQWLRGPLREWAGDLLAEDRLRREGYLRPEVISNTWQAHLRGQGAFGYRLWSVLMFQAWLQDQR